MLDDLISRLGNESKFVREAAINSLAAMGRDAVPALRECIRASRNPVPGLETLVRMGYPANAEAIPDFLEELRWPSYVSDAFGIAAKALVSIGEPSLDSIRKVFVEHPEEVEWVACIAWVLRDFDREVVGGLSDDLCALLERGFEEDPGGSTGVMELLGRVGSPRADRSVPALCNFYHRNQNPAQPEYPSNIRVEEYPNFREAVKEEAARIRRVSMRTLSLLDPHAVASAEATLQSAASDEDEQVRQLAVKVLASLRRLRDSDEALT